MRYGVLTAVAGGSLLLAGCASTRVAEIGWLPNHEPLVTLIVTRDRELIRRQCPGLDPAGVAFGCQMSRRLVLEDGTRVKAVKIVRYTDRLPSSIAFDIDAHELCHAIAAVQEVRDPCHDDDTEVIESTLPGTRAGRF